MRGALDRVGGVSAIGIEVGRREFDVTYDPGKTSVSKMLAALAASGEPAQER